MSWNEQNILVEKSKSLKIVISYFETTRNFQSFPNAPTNTLFHTSSNTHTVSHIFPHTPLYTSSTHTPSYTPSNTHTSSHILPHTHPLHTSSNIHTPSYIFPHTHLSTNLLHTHPLTHPPTHVPPYTSSNTCTPSHILQHMYPLTHPPTHVPPHTSSNTCTPSHILQQMYPLTHDCGTHPTTPDYRTHTTIVHVCLTLFTTKFRVETLKSCVNRFATVRNACSRLGVCLHRVLEPLTNFVTVFSDLFPTFSFLSRCFTEVRCRNKNGKKNSVLESLNF